MAEEFDEWPEVQTSHDDRDTGPRDFDFPLAVAQEGSTDVEHGVADVMPSEGDEGSKRSFVYKHRRELAVVIALIVVAAAITGALVGVRQHVDGREVLSSCQQSASIYQAGVKRLEKTVAAASDALAITEDQVQDNQTVQNLRTAVDAAKRNRKPDAGCNAASFVDANRNHDMAFTKATQALGNEVENILSAQSAVMESKTARDVAVAKADLANKVTEGQTVLGTVKSNDLTARQDLSAKMNEAQQLASSTLDSTDSYVTELNKLQAAIDKYSSTAIQ